MSPTEGGVPGPDTQQVRRRRQDLNWLSAPQEVGVQGREGEGLDHPSPPQVAAKG